MEGREATIKTEVEKFLLDKLQAGIDRKVPYSSKFKKIKEVLESELKSANTDKKKGKIREKLYLLNDLMNESNSKLDYFSWSLYSSLKQLKKELNTAKANGTGGPTPGTAPAPADEKSIISSATPAGERINRTFPTTDPLGLDTDKLAVKNLLLYQSGRRRDEFNAIGIVGAEGVGKTTLAQSIFYGDEEVKERFLPRIWISLAAEDPAEKDEGELQISIASRLLLALGISDEAIDKIRQSAANDAENRRKFAADTSIQATQSFTSVATDIEVESKTQKEATADPKAVILAALIHAVRLELTGKKYLIVLDDAFQMKNWYKDLSSEVELRPKKLEEKLAFAFPKGTKGTVLVIGWPENVVKYMVGEDENAIHRLLPLEDPKLCWKICEEEAEEDDEGGEPSEEKHRMEEEVVKRANGLPLAAKLMGKIRKENKTPRTNQVASTQAGITDR